jgi:hypothetical protein
MGPTTMFDKSALQALSLDETVWFDAFFLAVVAPVFYVETLADLEKETAEGKTPEAIVGRLAEKTPSSAAANVYHREMILGELLGTKIGEFFLATRPTVQHVGVRCGGKQADPRRESPLVLAAAAVKIGILVVATVVFIVVYGLLSDFLQRRGP